LFSSDLINAFSIRSDFTYVAFEMLKRATLQTTKITGQHDLGFQFT